MCIGQGKEEDNNKILDKENLAPVIGGAVAGVLGALCLCLAIGAIVFFIRRSKKTKKEEADPCNNGFGVPSNTPAVPSSPPVSDTYLVFNRSAASSVDVYAPVPISAINPDFVPSEPSKPSKPIKGSGSWEIPYSELIFIKEIGAGAFGKVYLGRWRGGLVSSNNNLN